MNLAECNLRDFNSRTLNILAFIFGGETRVILSERAVYPLTVVLESRTIVLDPTRTGLYDLALGARLLEHRALRRQGPAGKERKDLWLTREAHRRLVPQAQKALRQAFPGIGVLRGRYRPGSAPEGLQVVNRSIEWQPMPGLPPGFGGSFRPTGETAAADGNAGLDDVHCDLIPEVEINGAQDDMSWLLEALENGQLRPARIPGLGELPYLRVPLRICTAAVNPTIEELEEQLSQPENREIIESLMNCHRRKSEVRQERLKIGRHQFAGIHLDPNRLVDAAIGRRSGWQPRLFRTKGALVEPVFDPREHLTVISFDLNDLHDLDFYGGRAAIWKFIACIVTVFQRLEVDCVIRGHADRIVCRRDGSHVCLHFQTILKTLDEPFDDGVWSRLGQLARRPPAWPGTASCFHPLAVRDIAQSFDDTARDAEHSYRTMVWWARRGINRDFAGLRGPDFQMRMAEDIDHQVAELERRLTGTFDSLPSFLPDELKEYGQPGGYLASVNY
jgi:hypothetical protein